MKAIGDCCEGDYRIGPPPKAAVKPEVIIIATSAQHDQHMVQKQESKNGN